MGIWPATPNHGAQRRRHRPKLAPRDRCFPWPVRAEVGVRTMGRSESPGEFKHAASLLANHRQSIISIFDGICHPQGSYTGCVPARTAPATAAFRLDQQHGTVGCGRCWSSACGDGACFSPSTAWSKSGGPSFSIPRRAGRGARRSLWRWRARLPWTGGACAPGAAKPKTWVSSFRLRAEAQNPRTRGQRITMIVDDFCREQFGA